MCLSHSLGTKKEGTIMNNKLTNKLTYTIVEKRGETYDSYRYGGYDLTTQKTLAQSLVDACASDRALAGGLYATCAALVDIARNLGYALSRAVIDCIADPVISAAYDAVQTASANVATIRRQLTRAQRDADRLAYIPTAGLGGTADERDARERALKAALVDARERISVLSSRLADAQAIHRDTLAKLTIAEHAYYDAHAHAKKNATETNNNNNNNN